MFWSRLNRVEGIHLKDFPIPVGIVYYCLSPVKSISPSNGNKHGDDNEAQCAYNARNNPENGKP
jgi:hypothetical protein